MDEKSMIMEQERQETAKKQKKTKKIIWIVFGVAAVVIAAGVWYLVQGRGMIAASKMEAAVAIEADADQTIVYAKIVSIYGNEITYYETEEPVSQEQMEVPESGSVPEGFSGEMPEGFEGFGGGQMPEGFGGGGRGEMPEGFSGEMPEGFEGFGEGQMPEGFGGERPEMPAGVGQSSETITAYIPVGTEVVTKLGTVTTFSRLAAGDTVALIMENDGDEQVIMKVYIVG